MFGSKQLPRNYITKTGSLVPDGGGNIESAKLYIYNNGICTVNAGYFVYEATRVDDANY
jgi:hypothetical protein